MKRHRRTEIDFSGARVGFPADEKKFQWLPMLLDAYAIVDTGVVIAVEKFEEEGGKTLACRKGCDSCCRGQTDIPLYPLEQVGIFWYAAEKITGPAREALKERLLFFTKDRPCPFLIEEACSIHQVRPVSCRQFNVFGKPCGPGEDTFFTRREDVLTPIREFTVRAFSSMLPFYGVKEETEEEVDRIIEGEARNLKSVDWKRLYRIMEDFEAAHPEALK